MIHSAGRPPWRPATAEGVIMEPTDFWPVPVHGPQRLADHRRTSDQRDGRPPVRSNGTVYRSVWARLTGDEKE